MRESEWIEFRARPSSGRLWTTGLGLLVIALFFGPFIPAWNEIHFAVIAIFSVLGLVVSGLILIPAWYYPDIRYWLGENELILRYGPLMNDRIPLASITSVRRQDLRISPLSSFRFPGLALLDVHYRDQGVVRMCATSASKRIILIDTEKRTYGITPEHEDRFLGLLRSRAGDNAVLDVGRGETGDSRLETAEH